MAALLVFSGTQLVLLGLIGEYIGRMFLAVNQRPQSIVREVVRGRAELDRYDGYDGYGRDATGTTGPRNELTLPSVLR